MKEFFEKLSPHGMLGSAFLIGTVGGIGYVFLEFYALRKIEPMIMITPAAAL